MRSRVLLCLAAGLASASCGSKGTQPGGSPDPTPENPGAPTIVSFTASPAIIAPGGTSTLSWVVSGATGLSIDQGVGVVTGNQTQVSPGASTTYTLTAGNAQGHVTQTATVVVQTPGTEDVTVAIDTGQSRRPISPYVYGYNAGTAADAPAGATFLRIGGNRWTAYNWTNNWSNAGSDWGPYSNDTDMGQASNGAGYAIYPTIDDAKTHGIAALVTIPIQGYVSQARSGNVPLTDPVTSWFVPNVPAKGSAFTLTPSPTSATVYQDELANFVAKRWGTGGKPHISLDNEPDLWSSTHAEVQRTPLTYAAFLSQSAASASAIRDAAPGALIYGPVSYGWNGYTTLQNAPDAPSNAGADHMFLDDYLASMSTASVNAGKRLLDVLDVHFYSEAQSHDCADPSDDGVRVVLGTYDGGYPRRNNDCVVAARVQAPRSLGDPSYVETSWITQWSTSNSSLGAPIQLLPRLLGKIATRYSGTKLGVTEYNHGGEDHVSGAVAQSDALGMLGREGAYAASLWPMLDDGSAGTSWVKAAWRAYRNYDGAGHHFGDTSVSAATSDLDHLSVYASVDAASASRLVLVLIHRPTLTGGALDLRPRTVKVQWAHSQPLGTARAWQLTQGSTPSWQALSAPTVANGAFTLALPPLSVTTVELTP